MIKLHHFLLEDIISYFEKGESIKQKVNEIRMNIRQAIKFAKKKKKVYPSLKTNKAVDLFEEIYEELELTQKVLKEAAIEMEDMINKIKEERVIGPHSLVTEAQEYLNEKEFEKGIKLLKKAQKGMDQKFLNNTRKKFIARFYSEIKKLKYDIEEKEKSLKNENKVKIFKYDHTVGKIHFI